MSGDSYPVLLGVGESPFRLRNGPPEFLRGLDPLSDDLFGVRQGLLVGSPSAMHPGSSGTSATNALSSWLQKIMTSHFGSIASPPSADCTSGALREPASLLWARCDPQPCRCLATPSASRFGFAPATTPARTPYCTREDPRGSPHCVPQVRWPRDTGTGHAAGYEVRRVVNPVLTTWRPSTARRGRGRSCARAHRALRCAEALMTCDSGMGWPTRSGCSPREPRNSHAGGGV